MGNPELAGDPRVATDAERATNQKELIPQIERRMQSLPDDETVRGVPEEDRVGRPPPSCPWPTRSIVRPGATLLYVT